MGRGQVAGDYELVIRVSLGTAGLITHPEGCPEVEWK